MSELTRERIKDYIRRYEGTADFGTVRSFSADEQYELAKLALSALTARSEGFREGVEAAADICQSFAEMSRLYEPQPKTGRLTAEWCEGRIRALSPRETDEGYANAHPRELDAPASAPSSEVAEMVKRLRDWRLSTIPVDALCREAANLLSKVGQGLVPETIIEIDEDGKVHPEGVSLKNLRPPPERP